MATAADEPTAQQSERAREATTRPGAPTELGNPELRLLRKPPGQPLALSYARQTYRLQQEGEHLLLSPADARRRRALTAAPFPFEGRVHLLTAWSPRGEAGTFREFQRLHAQLHAGLDERGAILGEATAVASDGSWFEPQVIAASLTDDAAVGLASEQGQAAAIAWEGGEVTVLPTGLRQEVVRKSFPVTPQRLPSATCPVRADVDPEGRCVMWGGPWVSASIHAAALWQDHRAVGIQLLGCDSCDGGRREDWGAGGSAVQLASQVLASRYGNATWRPRRVMS